MADRPLVTRSFSYFCSVMTYSHGFSHVRDGVDYDSPFAYSVLHTAASIGSSGEFNRPLVMAVRV
jgi:hypothetical protein